MHAYEEQVKGAQLDQGAHSAVMASLRLLRTFFIFKKMKNMIIICRLHEVCCTTGYMRSDARTVGCGIAVLLCVHAGHARVEMDRLPVILSAIVLRISTSEQADSFTCFKKKLNVLEVDAVVATAASAQARAMQRTRERYS